MSTPITTPAAPAGTPPAAGTSSATTPAATPAAAPATPAAAATPNSTPAQEPAITPPVKAAETPPAKAEGEKPATPKPTEQKPVVPEKYDLKLPEGSALNPAYVEKISSFAKENGLSNEQAQKVLERDNAAVVDMNQALEQRQAEWIKSTSEDREIGGEEFAKNAELAKRVVGRFATEAFKNELNKNGFGNHPELVRTFVRIGKLMSEDQFIMPGSGSRTNDDAKSVEDKFYPKKEASPA